MKKAVLGLILTVLGLVAMTGFTKLVLAADPYEGMTIYILTGGNPGGGYDTYTRTITRHLKKHIPGNPTIVVSNMPGAGTLIAANYTYNKTKPNGLSIGQWNSGLVLYQALGDRKVRLDGRKVRWIAAPSKASPICAVMGFTGLRTLKDVLGTKKPLNMGGVRAGSPTVDLPKILNKTMGTKFEVIAGHRGTAGIRLAMQRHEIDGACWTWESMKVTARAMLDGTGDDKLIPFVIHDPWGDPEVKHLPRITDVIKGKNNLDVYNAWAYPLQFYRPFSFPPGTPEKFVTIFRKAFRATLEDPAFLADAERSKLFIHHVSGDEIERYVDQLLSISDETKKNLQFLVRKKKKKS
jgi:tripartite-type tricarboxylate transporter receptor subunit TctC